MEYPNPQVSLKYTPDLMSFLLVNSVAITYHYNQYAMYSVDRRSENARTGMVCTRASVVPCMFNFCSTRGKSDPIVVPPGGPVSGEVNCQLGLRLDKPTGGTYMYMVWGTRLSCVRREFLSTLTTRKNTTMRDWTECCWSSSLSMSSCMDLFFYLPMLLHS